MYGKIIDIDNTDAFVNFSDGTTMGVSVSRLPKDSKVGDTVDLTIAGPTNTINDRMIDFF